MPSPSQHRPWIVSRENQTGNRLLTPSFEACWIHLASPQLCATPSRRPCGGLAVAVCLKKPPRKHATRPRSSPPSGSNVYSNHENRSSSASENGQKATIIFGGWVSPVNRRCNF